MARNTPLQRPPYENSFEDLAWTTWFRNVWYKVSNANHQTLTGAGAISLDAQYVALNSSGGGFAVTLDAPTIPGVWKIIELATDGGDVTMALTNVVFGSASTTCTWNDARDTLVLYSTKDKWQVWKENGVVLS